MDATRFDLLTRSLSARGTRRVALGILPGLGLGHALAGTFARKKKKKSKQCPSSKKKCNRKCIPKNDCCQDANRREGEVCNSGKYCLPNCADAEGFSKFRRPDGCGRTCGTCLGGDCNGDGQCVCPVGRACNGDVRYPHEQTCNAADECSACPVGSDICFMSFCGLTDSGASCVCVTVTDGPICIFNESTNLVCSDCQSAEDFAAVLERPAAQVGCVRDTTCGVCPSTGGSGCVIKGCQDV